MAIGTTAAILGAGALGAGASMFGASKAADAQSDAANAANAMQWRMYQQQRQDLWPWRQTGVWGLNQLKNLISAGPGKFERSPGYKFRLDEGLNALDRSAASRGMTLSGRQDRAITQYGQDYASNEYDKWLARYYQSLNPFLSLANLGQMSNGINAQLGMNAANQMGQNTLYGGAARASGYIGQANAMNSGLNNFMMWNAMNNGNWGGWGGSNATGNYQTGMPGDYMYGY